jgi:AraC-like DNA-binding protein
MRQLLVRENDPGPGCSAATHSRDYPRDSQISEHAHYSDQLVYASCGIMEVASGQSLWQIPPHFGLWIPARVPHRIRMPEAVSMRTVYLRPGRAKLPSVCTVFHVSPLLRELIMEIVRLGKLRTHNRIDCALHALLVAELERASPVPTQLVLPQDQRALHVARMIMEKPACPLSLESMCTLAGISVRTLERTFRREVGIDFESWRRQVRLKNAVQLLVAGHRVKEVAYAVGYRQPSAFVSLFRATFGTTPKAWITALETPRIKSDS